jgi:N-acetylglucosamine-6-sulfatase
VRGIPQTRAIAIAALLGIAAAGTASAARPAEAAVPPNIVVIVTDDQTAASLDRHTMPATSRLLVDRGISFSQAIVSDPQCCPSRAAIYTGQYAHNNGVVSNVPGYSMLRAKRRILPAWLNRVGYRTIHIGKYMNGVFQALRFRPAPGWDRWLTATSPAYYSPTFSIDGKARFFEGGYLTSIENRMATRMIHRYAPAKRPFYLHLDQFGPHEGTGIEGKRCAERSAVPAPGDEGLFAGIPAPQPPNYDEEDVSDKPSFIQALPRLSAEVRMQTSMRYGCALASLREVDRGVADVFAALRDEGELRRTMVVFLSDNGYSFGEHRFPGGKGVPYEENLRVPLLMRPPASLHPSLAPGSTVAAPVANIDIAPTLLALAGTRPCMRGHCRTMDGRSLLPLLRGAAPAWTADRAIGIEFAIDGEKRSLSCAWHGMRTVDRVFVQHYLIPDASGTCVPGDEREMYDLESDPFELENLAGGGSPAEAEALLRSDRLHVCAGIAGRNRRTDGRPFCE